MWSIPFFVFSLVFAWMVYQAMRHEKGDGSGVGQRDRYYSRDDEPVRFCTDGDLHSDCGSGLLSLG